jgi:hypothetical protein
MLKIILSGFIEDILRLIRAGFFETPSPKKIQLYNELQQLKEVFSSLTGKPITEDSDIIDILV